MRRTRVMIVLALLSVAPCAVRAQGAPAGTLPAPGTRVRVTWASGSGDYLIPQRARALGRLVRVDADSIVIDDGASRVALARGRVATFEVSAGPGTGGRPVGRYAGRGFLYGVPLGALIALATYDGCDGWFCFSRSESTVLGAGFGGLGGLAIGATVGATVAPRREGWRRVPLPADARIGLYGGPRTLGLSVRL